MSSKIKKMFQRRSIVFRPISTMFMILSCTTIMYLLMNISCHIPPPCPMPAPTLPPTSPPTPPVVEKQDYKVLIVSLSVGKESSAYEQAMNNFESYANCHGYDFLNAGSLITEETTVHPFMQKAYVLQRIFDERENYGKYDFIMWVDRDAIFMNHQVSIPERLNDLHKATGSKHYYDLFIAVEGWAWLNSGVLLFRNTPGSKILIDKWINTYVSRAKYYESPETIIISGVEKNFSQLFQEKWSCEDQGALIALLAGWDWEKRWNTDRYDGLGVPHVLHVGKDEWAELSTMLILHPRYHSTVKLVGQDWLNTNPWDYIKSNVSFIYHFNGQNNKPALIHRYSKEVTHCSK